MANTIIGRILKVGQAVNVSRNKEFLKRELVLDCSRFDEFTGEKRENYVTLSFTQKRCEELDGYQQGDLVEVSFILSGRAYDKDGQRKYITDIIGYKVERRDSKASVTNAPAAPQVAAPQAAPQSYSQPQQPSQPMPLEEMPF